MVVAATWTLGTMVRNESKKIIFQGTTADKRVLVAWDWASYNPVLGQDIHNVKADIALTQPGPPEVLISDPIQPTLTG
jgi:hypothetical protein